jgi:plastocyanin
MTHNAVGVSLVLTVALSAACGHTPSMETGRTVRTVEISDQVNPHVVYASPGDEVRWTNARENAVRVGFLDLRLMQDHRCQKGIVGLFGQVNDLVTIAPGESISLCFARSGDLRYNVWFDAEDPRGAISPTMTISVRGG